MVERVKPEDVAEAKVDPKFAAGPIEEKLPETKAAEVEEVGEGLETIDDESDGPQYKRENIGPRLQDHAVNVGEGEDKVVALEEKLDADDVIALHFPKKVMLQDGGLMHTWEAGVHLVPVALANHWYLKHNKVKKAGPVMPRPSKVA